MIKLYVTNPKREIYNMEVTGEDQKDALLKVIDTFAPKAYDIAKIKKTMDYDEIETRFADDYLADYDKPAYPEYIEVSMKIKGKLRKLF